MQEFTRRRHLESRQWVVAVLAMRTKITAVGHQVLSREAARQENAATFQRLEEAMRSAIFICAGEQVRERPERCQSRARNSVVLAPRTRSNSRRRRAAHAARALLCLPCSESRLSNVLLGEPLQLWPPPLRKRCVYCTRIGSAGEVHAGSRERTKIKNPTCRAARQVGFAQKIFFL